MFTSADRALFEAKRAGRDTVVVAAPWFHAWGLANVHQERWSFGKGWSLVRFTAHLIEPQIQPLIGFPQEWARRAG